MIEKVKKVVYFLTGILLIAFAYVTILRPNTLAAGGLNGLSIILENIFDISYIMFLFTSSIFFLLLGLLIFGKNYFKRIVASSILYPCAVLLFSKMPIENLFVSLDIFVQAILAGVLMACGYSFILKLGYSMAGLDVVKTIFIDKLDCNRTFATILWDGFVVLCGGIAFGLESMIYALIVLLIIEIFKRKTTFGLNESKACYINTEKYEQIKEYLIENHYDVTLFTTQGGYSKKKGKILMCIIDNMDYYKIKEGILVIDPNAFVTVTNSYESKNKNKTLKEQKKKD